MRLKPSRDARAHMALAFGLPPRSSRVSPKTFPTHQLKKPSCALPSSLARSLHSQKIRRRRGSHGYLPSIYSFLTQTFPRGFVTLGAHIPPNSSVASLSVNVMSLMSGSSDETGLKGSAANEEAKVYPHACECRRLPHRLGTKA